jgi:hypothetical protein
VGLRLDKAPRSSYWFFGAREAVLHGRQRDKEGIFTALGTLLGTAFGIFIMLDLTDSTDSID